MSLAIGLSTVAESPMGLCAFHTTGVILHTTICSVMNLSVVQGSCLVDLPANEVKCVHESTPEVRVFNPRSFSRVRPKGDNQVLIPS